MDSTDCGRCDNVVPEQFQQFGLALETKGFGQCFGETAGVQKCKGVLTSALLRYCRCPSVIASKAELSGAKTVNGPERSMIDARPTFCSETQTNANKRKHRVVMFLSE